MMAAAAGAVYKLTRDGDPFELAKAMRDMQRDMNALARQPVRQPVVTYRKKRNPKA